MLLAHHLFTLLPRKCEVFTIRFNIFFLAEIYVKLYYFVTVLSVVSLQGSMCTQVR